MYRLEVLLGSSNRNSNCPKLEMTGGISETHGTSPWKIREPWSCGQLSAAGLVLPLARASSHTWALFLFSSDELSPDTEANSPELKIPEGLGLVHIGVGCGKVAAPIPASGQERGGAHPSRRCCPTRESCPCVFR